MRRSVTYAATTLAALLLLAACSGDPEPGSEETPSATATEAPTGTTPEDTELLEAVTVEGEAGAEPTVSFETPLEISGPAAHVTTPGDGETLEAGDIALVNFVAVDGTSGEVVESTYAAERQDPLVLGGNTMPALVEVLTGQQVGARVLYAVPGEAATSVMSIEVLDRAPARAEGAAADPVDGLPVVTLAESGEPSIEAADGEVPTELVVEPTIVGDGKVVEEGDTVQVHYSGWLWDGTPFDSSWERGAPFPVPVGAGQVIEGWENGLEGQTVGSQVLLVIPPELGYGEADQGTIPPNSTLVFVVDILHAS
ncbi:FKBP-type peptidyl-prolyl cis-trans isomerase [Georgenia sunbinii]|uniref:FKBP-type peptidyl-prolyl cis-trans isomerase n=1 Tax=Georgenia sunbinii TaxID=3117728 RepID=UPI002F269967